MYKNYNVSDLISATEAAIAYPIEHGRTGVSVYIDCNPDDVSPDIYIDPLDLEGIAIFRRFAAEFTAHLKTLK